MGWGNNPYTILGVPSNATIIDVKAAYRKIAQRLHPDVNPHPGAAHQFQEATEAYELLNDPGRKKQYDAEVAEIAKSGEEQGFFVLRVVPSKKFIVPLPEPQVVYLLADILPDPSAYARYQNRGTSLNLTLVLDRSNSMRDTRIERVKAAARQILDSMGKDDVISVVVFNDRAEVAIPATLVTDRPAIKASISMISTGGGTEIYQGLAAGMEQIHQYLDPRRVNHLILLTDGHTFGDQELCLELAAKAVRDGIGISAMGLGHDWNDEFLDDLASKTGGNTIYINSASAVVDFFENQVRGLINAFAERIHLSIAPEPDIQVESAFKLSPHPQSLTVEDGGLQLGSLQVNRPISVLLQLQVASSTEEGSRQLARLVTRGDILTNKQPNFQAVEDVAVGVKRGSTGQVPPTAILDALSKITLYRLQERAKEALNNGNILEATRRLENLATRLMDIGEAELGGQAMDEARRVAHTGDLSSKGRKTLKYQTRFLLAAPNGEDKNS